MSVRNANSQSVDGGIGKKADVPIAPSSVAGTDVGTAQAYNNGAVSVAFTPDSTYWPATSFTAVSSPGGFTATGAGSPLVVSGLNSQTAYTFTVSGTNSAATSAASSASSSVTATTVPQTPTIGTVTRVSDSSVSIPFTGNTGGKNLSAVTITSSPSLSLSYSGTTSPVTVSATYVSNQSYTFTMTTTNANGTSSVSTASNSVTPLTPPTPPVATPALWVDANASTSFTYSSSNVISQWSDLSGNNRHLTQSTVSAQPTLVTNVINSKPVVRFDSVNDQLNWTEFAPANRTLFFVFRNASNITSSGSFSFTSGSTSFPYYVLGAGNQTGSISGETLSILGVSTGGANIKGSSNSNTITAGNHQFNVTNSSTYVTAVRFDKSTLTMTPSPAQGDLASNTYPGYMSLITGSDGISLDIAEILIYDRVLSGSEITTVESYLTTKWAV